MYLFLIFHLNAVVWDPSVAFSGHIACCLATTREESKRSDADIPAKYQFKDQNWRIRLFPTFFTVW